MGLRGWRDLASEEKTLEGSVVDASFSNGEAPGFNDWDWCLKVSPDEGYKYLLTNPGVGEPNVPPIIECEIKPPDIIRDFDGSLVDTTDLLVAERFIFPLRYGHVQIRGTWAADCSHAYGGHIGWPKGYCDTGKTEIHPITSILQRKLDEDSGIERISFLVSSENKVGQNHRWENRVGTFKIPCLNGEYTIQREAGTPRSKSYQITTDANNNQWLEARVESGTLQDGQGFYAANIYVRVRPPKRQFSIDVNPTPTPVRKNIQITVRALDAQSGAPVDGTVVVANPEAQAQSFRTNSPFTFSFNPKLKLTPGKPGSPPVITLLLPTGKVQASNYADATVPFKFDLSGLSTNLIASLDIEDNFPDIKKEAAPAPILDLEQEFSPNMKKTPV